MPRSGGRGERKESMEKEGKHMRSYEINGEVRTLKDWCRKYGVTYGAVQYRMLKQGMNLYEALTKPSKVQEDESKCPQDCIYGEVDGQGVICMYLVLHVPPQRRPCKPGKNCTEYTKMSGSRKTYKGVF